MLAVIIAKHNLLRVGKALEEDSYHLPLFAFYNRMPLTHKKWTRIRDLKPRLFFHFAFQTIVNFFSWSHASTTHIKESVIGSLDVLIRLTKDQDLPSMI